METIYISEEQKNKLCSRLVQFVQELKKDESVESIYFAPYKNLGEIKGNVLKITIVVKDGIEYEKGIEYDSEYKKEHEYEEDTKNFGIKLYIGVDSSRAYTTFPLNPSERLRGNKLFNSTILFDRTGEYTQIKEKVDRIGTEGSCLYYYINLAQIEPPIIDGVNRLIEDEQLQEETKAVKESMKTKLFEQFKKI